MNVSEKIAGIQAMQKEYARLQKEIKSGIKAIEKGVLGHFNARVKKEFPGVKFFALFTGEDGCLTDRWGLPRVYVEDVGDYNYSGSYWYSNYPTFVKVDPPVPTKKLLDFLKTVSEETGVKFTLSRQNPFQTFTVPSYDYDGRDD